MSDITITPDIEYNGGSVTVHVGEYVQGDGTVRNSASATFPSAGPSATVGGFDGQDGTREYAVELDIQTPDATRSPAVNGVSLSVPSVAYQSHWRLAGIPIDGHTGPESVHTYGGGYELEVWLSPASNSPAGAWPDHRERYHELLRYQNHAGAFELHELTSDRVAFTETHSASTDLPNGSLLVAFRPPANQQCGRGMWCLISSFEDMTMEPKDLCRVSLELTFAAPLDRYPDHAAAHDALASERI